MCCVTPTVSASHLLSTWWALQVSLFHMCSKMVVTSRSTEKFSAVNGKRCFYQDLCLCRSFGVFRFRFLLVKSSLPQLCYVFLLFLPQCFSVPGGAFIQVWLHQLVEFQFYFTFSSSRRVQELFFYNDFLDCKPRCRAAEHYTIRDWSSGRIRLELRETHQGCPGMNVVLEDTVLPSSEVHDPRGHMYLKCCL